MTSELIHKSTLENSDIRKTESLVEKELDDNLAISFFDQVIGPRIFYCSDNKCYKDFDLFSFLDVLEPGTFIFAFKKFHTINHIFTIDSKHARGYKEILMLTYMIRNFEIEDTYRYLKSKTLVLEELAKELRELTGLSNILNRRNKPKNVLELGSETFNHTFLSIYNKYYKKLSSKFKIMNPLNELKPQEIDTHCIKIYLKPVELSHAINAFLFKRKVVFLIEKESKLKEKILNFFKFLFQDSFKIDLAVKFKKIFNKNKKLIIWWGKKRYNIENLKYLKDIVKNFYSEADSISALINLRDKIRETYVLTQRICENVEKGGDLEYLHRKQIVRDLETVFYVKIKKGYIFFLNEVVKNYHGLNIKWFQDFIAERIDKMWRH